jgi:hypothetical protein
VPQFQVNINALGFFDTIDGARAAAQAIDILLGSGAGKQGSVAIWDVKERKAHPVIRPVMDRSKIVVGFQEAEGNATKYTGLIEKGRTVKVEGETPATEFWAGFIAASRNAGNIDMEALEVLATERLGDADAATAAVVGAVATVASNDVARTLQTLKASRAKAAARNK